MPARPSLVPFFAVAFAVSWLGALPMVLASHGSPWGRRLAPLQLLMLFGTGLAAAWAAWREGGWPGVKALLAGLVRWRVGARWWLAALLGPAVAALAGLALAALAGLAAPRWPSPGGALAAFGASFAAYLLLNTEELAWRGFALPRLQERMSPLAASVLLGAVWTVFHLPLYAIRGGHPAGHPPWLFVLMVLVLSILLTWAYDATGGSILVCHVLHQSVNAWPEALGSFPLAAGSVAPTAASVAAVAALLLALRVPQRLAREEGLRRAAARAPAGPSPAPRRRLQSGDRETP